MPSFWRKTMLYLGLGPDDEYEEYDVDDGYDAEPGRGSARPAPRQAGTPRPATVSAKAPPAKVATSPASRPTAPRPAKAAPRPATQPARPKPPAPSAPPPPADRPKVRASTAKPPPPSRAAPPPPAKARPSAKPAPKPAPKPVPKPVPKAVPKAAPKPPAKPARPAPKPARPAPPPPEPAEVPAARAAAEPAAPKPRPVVRAVPANSKPHIITPRGFDDAQEVADKFKGKQPVVMDLRMADGKLARRFLDFSSGVCYGLGGGMEKVGAKVYLLVPEDVEVSADERRRLHDRGLAD